MRSSQAAVGQRERLLSLGRLSAGLTHELNNPAAAAVRATAALRERVSRMRGKLAHLASGEVDPEALRGAGRAAGGGGGEDGQGEELSPMEVAEAEDEISDWLDDHGVADSWDLSPALVAAGVNTDWLDEVADTVPPELLPDGIHWLAYALETEQLMVEIEDSTDPHLDAGRRGQAVLADGPGRRIRTSMSGTARQHPDHARPQDQGVGRHQRVKDFDRVAAADSRPSGRAQPGLDEPDRQRAAGHARRRHADRPDAAGGDCVLVEICDTGPGVPQELQPARSSSPSSPPSRWARARGSAWTSRYRVVAQRHGGDLRVVSQPGDTRFQVRLPINEPPSIN